MSNLYVTYITGKARFAKGVKSFLSDKSGVTAIEYGLIAALIAVIIIPAVTLLGGNLLAKFQAIAAAL
jgi:pilus assembly protein Flp/PilA